MQKQKLILIGGPTAVGKTALSLRIAEMFDGEIISCDSVAVYKGMDIGSAKPTKEKQQNLFALDEYLKSLLPLISEKSKQKRMKRSSYGN